jgi:RNA polymerase sigma-70 factor (ECF subfamily)
MTTHLLAPERLRRDFGQTARVDEPSDDALMLAYADGDAAAFERLYRRHQAGLYRFVRRLLGPALAAQADEVFQDTWLKVVQSRGRWRAQDAHTTAEQPAAPARSASFRTWLYTLAHHRVIDLWRRSGREVSLDAGSEEAPWAPEDAAATAWQLWPAADGGSAPAAPASEDIAFWRRAGERLLHCLDQLPLAQRSAFLLHHDDGLPLEEVAQAVGVGFETAKTRLRYAMAKLRGCMGAYLAPPAGDWT